MRIDEPTSILVFRNGSIGNTLVALPAIRALKDRFPNAALAVVLDSLGAELLQHVPFIDTIISYDKRGVDKSLSTQFRFVRKLRRLHPTHAILFKRFFRNGLLAFLSGAKYRIGFKTAGKAPFLNVTISYDESLHIAQLNLNLLALLGVDTKLESYSIPLSKEDQQEAVHALQAAELEGKRFVAVHYGGSTTKPDFFPVRRMSELLRPVVKSRAELAFVAAGFDERVLAESAIAELGCGKLLCDLPVRAMAAVLSKASCFIGFNSGPAHIAAGVRTPGIVIYRPDLNVENEIRKWRPLFEKLTPVIPPAADDDSAWREFINGLHARISTLLADEPERL
ncbi:lipopolysaccharide heptosyltransferase family protein [bacterium]|nr:MAG: lipopolysaccharide heptosyltransferase family protein [bacterium]